MTRSPSGRKDMAGCHLEYEQASPDQRQNAGKPQQRREPAGRLPGIVTDLPSRDRRLVFIPSAVATGQHRPQQAGPADLAAIPFLKQVPLGRQRVRDPDPAPFEIATG